MAGPRYDVFISYRRESGAAEALVIHQMLTERGLRVFLDVSDLTKGYFDETLLTCIAETPNFLVVLSPDSLDRCANAEDWLRREIAQACKSKCNIIPVIMLGFRFPRELPEDIKSLPRHQGVLYSHDYYEAMVAKIAASIEADRADRERLQQERAQAERLRAENEAEEKRLAQEQAERQAREAAETERRAKEKAEQERLARARAEEERRLREEAERLAREKAEQERLAQERAEREAREREEKERLAREAERERLEQERAEAERLRAERQAGEKRRMQERAQREAGAREEKDRLAREAAEAERRPKQEAEQERLARERAEEKQTESLCMGCMANKGSSPTCPNCGWEEGHSADSPLQLTPRTILDGRYLVGRALGQGGFGITYLAWDFNLNCKLAVKEYFPIEVCTRGRDERTVQPLTRRTQERFEYGLGKFLEEGQALARFRDHPGIASVLGFFQENGTAYLVMAYLEGLTFKQYLEEHDGKIPFQAALNILTPVMDALREVHAVGMLHRDISPDNIYLTKNRQVKILDFGAARYAMGEVSQGLSVVLKPGYAPEEQYRRRGRQGPWTDVYALGATFYRAITGIVPSDAPDRLAHDDLVPPGRLRVNIPAKSEAALLKALAVHAENRFQSIAEFQSAVSAAALTEEADAGGTAEEGPSELAREAVEAELKARQEEEAGRLRAEAERKAREQAEAQERARAEQLRAEKESEEKRRAHEQTERDAREKAEAKRLARERAAADRAARWRFFLTLLGSRLRVRVAIAVSLIAVGAVTWYLIRLPKPPPPIPAATQGPEIGRSKGAPPAFQKASGPPSKRAGSEQKGAAPSSGATTPRAGTVRDNPKDGQKHVWIPPGTFKMGCSPGDTDCGADEKRSHSVTLSKGFWIGQTEVTVGAYKRFAAATGREMPAVPTFNSGWANDGMPIVNVSWNDARDYCRWAGGRLPTEAEWEYAARGGSAEGRYGSLDEVAWYRNNSGAQTHEVAQKRANGFGLYDTLGNVWEWVNDWYDGNYYQHSPSQDPSGSTSGSYRVLRGGSWLNFPRNVRVSGRSGLNPIVRIDNLGVRCAREVDNP